MKKTLFVVALATMLVLAVASSAVAVGPGQTGVSGQLRGGAAAIAPALVPTLPTPATLNIAGAGTNTYMDWSLTVGLAPGNGQNDANLPDYAGNSPHGNYTTTTVKCVVCHAVHYAAPGAALGAVGNFTVASGNQSADTLLRRRADQACAYCHATAGQAVNGRPVYNGLGGAALTGALTGGAFNTGHYTGTNCNCCHSSVHGANADHSVAALDGFLLLKLPVSNVQASGFNSTDMYDAITAIDLNAQNQGYAAGAALAGTPLQYKFNNTSTLREQAVGIFCAECHNGAYATAAPGAATNVRGSGTVAFSGHRIAAAATTNWNSTGAVSSGDQSLGTVAWAAANNCKSCHDATDNYNNAAFPHAWGNYNTADPTHSGTKMWLMSGADAGATETTLPAGAAAGAGYDQKRPQLSDGVCLKCHVASGGTQGVGITF